MLRSFKFKATINSKILQQTVFFRLYNAPPLQSRWKCLYILSMNIEVGEKWGGWCSTNQLFKAMEITAAYLHGPFMAIGGERMVANGPWWRQMDRGNGEWAAANGPLGQRLGQAAVNGR